MADKKKAVLNMEEDRTLFKAPIISVYTESARVVEQRLIIAILERAILDAAETDSAKIRSNRYDPAQVKKEAIRWLRLDQESISEREMLRPKNFSFVWICQHLGLCPIKAQQVIKKRLPIIYAKHRLAHGRNTKSSCLRAA